MTKSPRARVVDTNGFGSDKEVIALEVGSDVVSRLCPF